jgi:methionyl-tRNA formyltransferase
VTRVAFLGMDSAFSVRALDALVDDGHDIVLVMRPTGGRETRRDPVLVRERTPSLRSRIDDERRRTDLTRAAKTHEIPTWSVGDASSERVRALLCAERIDMLAIAFFNQLLDVTVLERLPLGAVNAHPSLLPSLRGPAPLFWTFRDALPTGGLTVHVVTPGEDDGDIVFQEPIEIPLGTPGEQHVHDLASTVGALLSRAVTAVSSGTAALRRQDPALATRAPRPKKQDLVLHRELGARRLFHFVRGFGRFQPLVIEIDGGSCRVIDAIDFDPERSVPADHAIIGDTLLIACHPGMVALKLDPSFAG